MMWGYGWGYWFMGLAMIVFWALVIAGIVFLVRYTSGSRRPAEPTAASKPSSSPAEDALAQRLARGDIDEEEYRRRLDALRTGR